MIGQISDLYTDNLYFANRRLFQANKYLTEPVAHLAYNRVSDCACATAIWNLGEVLAYVLIRKSPGNNLTT